MLELSLWCITVGPLLLNVDSVVDVPSPSALHVCSDIVKYFAADTTTNKVGDHVSVTMVVEKILHGDGNKAVDSDVIADLAEAR